MTTPPTSEKLCMVCQRTKATKVIRNSRGHKKLICEGCYLRKHPSQFSSTKKQAAF